MVSGKKNYLSIALATVCLLFLFSFFQKFYNLSPFAHLAISQAQSIPLQSHPLPVSLQQWQDDKQQGDYFELIETTSVGYFIWSQFPVKVYIERPEEIETREESAADKRQQQWVEAVKSAVTEWNVYLPLQEVEQSELADIKVLNSSVDREIQLNPDTGLYDIPQAITAQTSYKIYVRESSQNILAHGMIIKISPDLSFIATLAAARHELGHALGIWGHSDRSSDALYFSQVRDTPQISPRDINTLKKIYQQPTRLGWEIDR